MAGKLDAIISPDVVKTFEDVKRLSKDVVTNLKKIFEEASKLNGELKKIDTGNLKKLANVEKKSADEKKKLLGTQKELLSLDKKRQTAINKVAVAMSDENQSLLRLKESQRKQTQEQRLSIQVDQAKKGTIERLKAELKLNELRWNQLTVAERKNSATGKELSKTIRQQRKDLQKNNVQLGRAGGLMRGLRTHSKNLITTLGAGLGILFFARQIGNAVKKVVEFQKAQSTLLALSGKTKESMAALTDQAKALGATTEFTATQITGLQIELTKLGFTTDEIQKATRSVSNFASATGADLAAAAKTAGIAINSFGLDAKNTRDVVSVLAVATTKSAIAFEDYDVVLGNLGAVSRSYGFTLVETIALLAKLRDAGLDASKSSTAFRNIILNLADSNGKLAKRLGGSVKSFDELIPALIKLRQEGVDLNETLQLTDKRSVTAFNQFLTGAESASALRDSLTGVNSQLDDMVEKKLDNLAGDVTRLGSAWEGFVLQAEEGVNGFRVGISLLSDLIIQVANLDLVVKRTTKFTEQETRRFFDIMLGLSGKVFDVHAKIFQDLEKLSRDVGFFELIEQQGEFKDSLIEAGATIDITNKLWDELLRRKQSDIRLTKEDAVARRDLLKGGFFPMNDALTLQIALLDNYINGLIKAEETPPLISTKDVVTTQQMDDILQSVIDKQVELAALEAEKDSRRIERDISEEIRFGELDEPDIDDKDNEALLDAELDLSINRKKREVEDKIMLAEQLAESDSQFLAMKLDILEKDAEADIMAMEQFLATTQLEADEEVRITNELEQRKLELKQIATDKELLLEERKRRAILMTLGIIRSSFSQQSLMGKVALSIERANAIKSNLISLGVIGAKQAEGEAKAAASVPWPLNIPIIAATIAQFIGIISTFTSKSKIPAFAKGTLSAPGGPILWGEAGGELAFKGNKMMYADSPTISTGMKGFTILNSTKTNELINNGAGFDDYGIKDAILQSNNKLIKAIKNQPQPTYDKRGMKISERFGKHRKEWLRKKIYE